MNNELTDIAEQFLEVLQQIRNEIGNNKFGSQQEFTNMQLQQIQLKDEIKELRNRISILELNVKTYWDIIKKYYPKISD